MLQQCVYWYDEVVGQCVDVDQEDVGDDQVEWQVQMVEVYGLV